MQLLPRTSSQILSDATRAYGKNWRKLVAPALIGFIPGGLISLAVFRWTGAADFVNVVLEQPTALQALPAEVLREMAMPFVRAALVALVVQLVTAVFVFLACHRVVISDVGDEPVASREAVGFAARRLIPTATAVVLAAIPTLTALLVGFTIWLGPASSSVGGGAVVSLVGLVLLIAFLAPGLWLLVSFSMVTAVMATESRGISEALARSIRLVRGRRLATLGFLVLVGLLGLIAIQLIELVAIPVALVGAGGGALLVASVLGIGIQGLIVAAIAVPVTVWYIDLRSRSETLLSEDLI